MALADCPRVVAAADARERDAPLTDPLPLVEVGVENDEAAGDKLRLLLVLATVPPRVFCEEPRVVVPRRATGRAIMRGSTSYGQGVEGLGM